MKHKFFLAIIFLTQVACAQLSDKTLMIQLAVSDDHYVLQDSWLVDGVFPATADTLNHQGLRWALLDENKTPITQGWLADPQKVHGAFVPKANGSGEYHHLGDHRVDSAVVIIRAPYDQRMKTLLVERQAPIDIATQVSGSSAQPAPKPADRAEFPLNPRLGKKAE